MYVCYGYYSFLFVDFASQLVLLFMRAFLVLLKGFDSPNTRSWVERLVLVVLNSCFACEGQLCFFALCRLVQVVLGSVAFQLCSQGSPIRKKKKYAKELRRSRILSFFRLLCYLCVNYRCILQKFEDKLKKIEDNAAGNALYFTHTGLGDKSCARFQKVGDHQVCSFTGRKL